MKRCEHPHYSMSTCRGFGLAIWSWLASVTLLFAAAQPQVTAQNPGSPSQSPVWAPLQIKDSPTTEDICAAVLFNQQLMPVGEPTENENRDLLLALQTFARRTVRDDFSSLTSFLELHPENPWAMAVETQLGHELYHTGHYSRAIDSWKHIWDTRKSAQQDVAVALVNHSASQLAMMYARLGRMTDLRPLLAELDHRSRRGQSAREIRAATDGLWSMDHKPEVSFRCGPLALDRICFATDRAKAGSSLVENSESTTNGFSAQQVAALSRQLGMNYQVAFRAPGSTIILPAVVHWKVGHYAALIARDGPLIRAEDPTFGNMKMWLSDEALDQEASGYFLVRAGDLPPGWRRVSDLEAAGVWGKGTTHQSDEDSTTDKDLKTCHLTSQDSKDYNTMTSHDPHEDPTSLTSQNLPGEGMPQWDVHLMLASHHVQDIPVGYTPPVGPAVYTRVSYDSVNGWPDYGLPYSNVSQEWRLDWLAYVTDDPMNPAGDIQFAANGGGTLIFSDFNPTNQVFKNLFRNVAMLVRTGTNSYELRYPNGSKKIFAQPDGSVGTLRKIFMTAIVDPAGNAATLQFDLPGRIISITDAIGQKTQFFYDLPITNVVPTLRWVPPYLLTRVVDPFGRTASFQYTSSVNARMASITDVLGLTSSFVYDYNPGLPDLGMINLITPYGTTIFKRGSYSGAWRANWVEITYPDGEKERVEYSEIAGNGIPSSEPLSIVPKGVPVRNYILYARNTYYWDRRAYAQGYSPLDYSGARVYHWAHELDYTTTSPILESFKAPLQHRVWFTYDGQTNASFAGTSDRPTSIARTMEDGTTQFYQLQYNSLGNTTKAIDPLGREISLLYSSNELDLVEIRQTRAGQNELLLSTTYNSQHRPLTVTDAARQTTRFSYNARGQIIGVTNALGDATTFSYDTNGYLLAVDGPLPGTTDSSRYTYDVVGRLRTVTDQDGYTLTFDYDAFDRLTRITYPDSTFEQITYDRLDPAVLRDRLGRETHLTYDSLRRLTSVQDKLGRVTHFQWCGCGGLESILDPLGRMTSWIHDLQGRVKAKVYADGSQIQYEYDTATGWLKTIRDEKNQVTRFDYNLDGTLSQKRFFNARVPTPSVKLTYDPNYRRLLTMEDGTGLTTYSYYPVTGAQAPGAGRLASIVGPFSNETIDFTYDELGREAARSINGVGVRRSWDAAGRLTQLTNILGVFHYSWNGSGGLLSGLDYPNGQRTAFNYFPNVKDRLLQAITNTLPGGNVLSDFTYDYGSAPGQIAQWTQERPASATIQYQFGYDDAGQLTNATTGPTAYTYAYDAAGNRTQETTSTGSHTFICNALNQITSVEGSAPGNVSYEWDARNLLTAINQDGLRTEFTYDGAGRRVRMLEISNGIVLGDKRFVWCGSALCEERDGTGTNVLKQFSTHGVRVLNGSEIPPGTYFFTRDHLQSIREMTDSGAQLRAQYDYDPFGRRTRIGGDLDSDLGFTGHYFLTKPGLHLAVYRAYNAEFGRWLSRDPLGERAGLNLYAYVLQNPINRRDPLGLDGLDDIASGQVGGLVNPSLSLNLGNFGLQLSSSILTPHDWGLQFSFKLMDQLNFVCDPVGKQYGVDLSFDPFDLSATIGPDSTQFQFSYNGDSFSAGVNATTSFNGTFSAGIGIAGHF